MIRTISIFVPAKLFVYAKVCLALPRLTYFNLTLSHSYFRMFFISDVCVERLRNANDKIYYLLNCIRRSVRFTSISFEILSNCTTPYREKKRSDSYLFTRVWRCFEISIFDAGEQNQALSWL